VERSPGSLISRRRAFEPRAFDPSASDAVIPGKHGPMIGRPAARSWPDAPRCQLGAQRRVSVGDSEPYRAVGSWRRWHRSLAGPSRACMCALARASVARERGAARCHPHHSMMLLGCSSCCRHRARSRLPCGRCQTGMSLISCDLWPRELTAQDRVKGRTYRLNDGYMKRGASMIRLYVGGHNSPTRTVIQHHLSRIHSGAGV
jgi:hypothetical protein